MQQDLFILSASRRTDIPAFYAEWMMRRLREGVAEYIHPYTGARHRVPLDPGRVAAIVFWTKNFEPMLDGLRELGGLGYERWLVHYTITGLGRDWEPRVPAAEKSIQTFLRLAEAIGPQRIIWRFDPMVLTRRAGIEPTIERFATLSQKLKGSVKSCVTSMMAPYKKIAGRVAAFEKEHGDQVLDPAELDLSGLSIEMAKLARQADMTISACCTEGLAGFGVQPARCIDAQAINRLWPGLDFEGSPSPTRKGCGCSRAIDIGAYDTCPHKCIYCYANASQKTIDKRNAAHHPDYPSIWNK